MYEIHIFELWNEEINVKKILAVIKATYAAAKRKPEKIRLAGIRTLTSAIPVQNDTLTRAWDACVCQLICNLANVSKQRTFRSRFI